MSKALFVRSPSSPAPSVTEGAPTSSSAEDRAAARRAAALHFLASLLTVVSTATATRVCDAVCELLLALRGEFAVETFERIIAGLDAQEHALFDLVFTAVLGMCPSSAVEDLDAYAWREPVVRDAVCHVMTARLARGA